MKRLIIVLVVLVGCAGAQHKHPHDHGISAYKGHVINANYNVRTLTGIVFELKAENVSMHGSLTSLEERLEKAEEKLKPLLKKMNSLRRVAPSYYFWGEPMDLIPAPGRVPAEKDVPSPR